MKKIHQTLWEKCSFEILYIFFSHLCNKVHIFDLILLKLSQIIRINHIENEENLSNIMGKKVLLKICLIFSCLCNKVHIFYLILLKRAQILCIIVRINPNENEENLSNIVGKEPI